MNMRTICLICMLCLAVVVKAASPIQGLLERIDKGASRKFVIEQVKSPTDFFELDQKGDKVVIRGNNYVSIATGVNWYLKYYAGIQLSWNGMTAQLPAVLPAVPQKERHETDLKYRYDFNYCTYSYTMAFWDWDRWEKEIDWMALHGINLPLAVVGADVVWYNVLTKLGYTKDEINEFIAGPAFQGWWLMNNLEGWGGPNPDSWYKQRETLQKQILKRMREYGIRPVLPGYSGMVPHNAKERLGLNVSDPGLWCGYRRPAFLQPTDPRFNEIADLYYKEMSRLYGKADFYSMDPFHEGGNVAGVDLNAAGQAIWGAMKKANPKAVWVAQAWQANPRQKMIENLPAGDLIVLDLFAESRPQWGDPESTWYRKEGFGKHDWLYCMLLNYGGNVGLHGKMKHVIDEFYKAKTSSFGKTMKGVGMTMEGSENNPVMFELLCELPWRPARFDKDEWLKNYTVARYGKADKAVQDAWLLLSNTIYNCPAKNTQQGTHESVFCGRPDYDVYQVSSWSEMEPYYKPEDIIRAAGIMLSAADRFKGNNNFEYDLIDIVRQAVAEKGRLVYPIMIDAYKAGEKELFAASSQRFLDLILLQDKLLAARPEFKVGTWIEKARNLGTTPEEKDLYEWNARVQVTTWGNRVAADEGGLRDYAHKEWNGLLRDFYYNRWKVWIDRQKAQLNGAPVKAIDFYAIEEPWTKQTNPYSSQAEGDVIEVAKEVYAKITE
ncbi:alpha-N-acetylglucosaminidase [Phocaeicola massiliensis]|nr:alpha-N-acetylglucosaminidase [Phocaeicola massiliensis]MBS4837712.1 alpha-N-acetylglucosaminidase [Phocaeicola massiliensis]MBV3497790.1 alpha-N-acetylglucosaminidase [Phocaeicola massiliensis]MCM1614343.1 alpha-N-acetylglucosaminidase [Phocaeicola massiliensis]MCM1704934.1 alpha-N-acetylglucosaminidase [Phocaeicola massiliensis]